MNIRAILILIIVFLCGCSSSMTSHKEMFSGPDLGETKPRVITNLLFHLPPRLDVADSAFFYDLGIKTPSMSWKAIMWEKKGDDYETHELKAVRLKQADQPPQLIITIPTELKEVEDNYIAVVDHAGRRIFNKSGEFIMRDWRKIKADKFSRFLDKVGESNPLELEEGEPDYRFLVEFYKKFAALEAIQLRSYIYKQEGLPEGSALSKKEVKRIEKKYESQTAKLKDLFTDNWYVLFTYPLLSPEAYGSYIMVSKLFQIPSVWWKDDVDRPGYMDRQVTAVGAFDMMNYYMNNYVKDLR